MVSGVGTGSGIGSGFVSGWALGSGFVSCIGVGTVSGICSGVGFSRVCWFRLAVANSRSQTERGAKIQRAIA
jgi:hypothetical protein